MDTVKTPVITRSQWRWMLIILVSLLVGLFARLVVTDSSLIPESFYSWIPGMNKTSVTLYYTDGEYLVPVSREVSSKDANPNAIVDNLLSSPTHDSHLKNVLPDSDYILDVVVDGDSVTIDLSARAVNQDFDLIHLAITRSLLSISDVKNVMVTVEGTPIDDTASSNTILYFWQDTRLVGVPIEARDPREALSLYLGDWSESNLTGLPADVELLSYEYESSNGLLILDFSYTSTLRDYAVDNPEAMRQILIGLIASMTDYPEIKAVMLNFEGHSQLGLGQCANLLRAPQTHPEILNDERTLK